MERLGLGPDVLLARNPRLVYRPHDRLGPGRARSRRAPATTSTTSRSTGALHAIGRAGEAPVPPLNLVGDFGGGGMLLALRRRLRRCSRRARRAAARSSTRRWSTARRCSRRCSPACSRRAAGAKSAARTCSTPARRGTTSTRRRTASTSRSARSSRSSIAELLERLGLPTPTLPAQHDRAALAGAARALRARLRDARRATSGARVFEGSDACFAPVLTFSGGARHPHALARDAYTRSAGSRSPPPRRAFRPDPGAIGGPPPERGAGGREALRDWGFDAAADRAPGLGSASA